MFLQMGQFGPHPHFSICFGVMAAWGIATSWGCGSTIIVGVKVGVGELTSSFLTQTNFLMLTLLQAMECLLRLGYLQVLGGCQLRNLFGGFPWNFPFSKFIMVMGIVSGVCMVMLLALGVGTGLATTHTLYLLVGISFLLLSIVFVPLTQDMSSSFY